MFDLFSCRQHDSVKPHVVVIILWMGLQVKFRRLPYPLAAARIDGLGCCGQAGPLLDFDKNKGLALKRNQVDLFYSARPAACIPAAAATGPLSFRPSRLFYIRFPCSFAFVLPLAQQQGALI